MENVDIKLNDGEVTFVSNGVNMIINTATLLELCEKLGVVAQQNSENKNKAEDKCTCNNKECKCTCTSKNENAKQNEEDDYYDEDDEEVKDNSYSRIVAVRYNPYHERSRIRDDWRDGLQEVVGICKTADDAADKFGVKSTSDVIKSADTWESIGALLSDKIISVVNMKQNDEIKYYAKDMLDKDISIQLYCMTDYIGNEYVAFMYEDDVNENLPLYHEVLFKNKN